MFLLAALSVALMPVSCGENGKDGPTVPVESVTISLSSLTMEVGQTLQLEVEVLPENATNKNVVWASSDDEVANVSEKGLVTVRSAGIAEITATCGKARGLFTVIVPAETAVAVDMGLPSGLKWASYNLGATKPEEFGDYYAWGEVVPRSENFTWETYKFYAGWDEYSNVKLSKYFSSVDNLKILQRGEKPGESVDDAARARLGGKWRMPTEEEFRELYNNCDILDGFTTLNGVRGFKFVNTEHPEKWIFLPAAGCLGDDTLDSGTSYLRYWSSTRHDIEDSAACLRCYFKWNESGSGINFEYRCYGLSIRPVCEE